MKRLRSLLVMVPLLSIMTVCAAATSGGAANKRAQNQMELNEKACAAYKQADAEMNKVYRRILSENSSDRLFVQKMRAAQRAWVIFRDAHLASIYPAVDKRGAYGSINPMCQCMELEKITDERLHVLQQWVTGIEEGDVCGGSIKVKQ
jgi:uncharacterized protein YecT (DUF1311 family)